MTSGIDILEKIVRSRRERLGQFGYSQGLQLPPERQVPLVPFPESPFLICEVKRSSPSAGTIAKMPDPTTQVDLYTSAGVKAVSVLTEEEFFGGSLRDLEKLKSRNPETFFLRKDFLLEPEDIDISWRIGADAVLLIAALLEPRRMEELYRRAVSLGLEVLVEVHNSEEIEKIRSLRPATVGINARDLRDFSIDCSPRSPFQPYSTGRREKSSNRESGRRNTPRWPSPTASKECWWERRS